MIDAIPGYHLAGAVVRRSYSQGGERVSSGAVLTRDAFLSIGHAVRRLFVREGRVTPFYVPAEAAPPPPGERHVIHRGGGRYDVVHGVLLTELPVTREGAEALAAQGRS
jgi:hypothetical protein